MENRIIDMTNKEDSSKTFLEELIHEIEQKDPLHYKKLKVNLNLIIESQKKQFDELLNLIFQYFTKLNIKPNDLAGDYLKMVNDMRREGLYFLKSGEYSCKNQSMAFDKVYSNEGIMSYYMNALLISQILWKHHFNMFIFFRNNLNVYFNANDKINILDVGPGHGFFSFIIKNSIPNFQKIDIVDISNSSLIMTEKIIGKENGKINYHNADIFNFNSDFKYDLIIIGEVIEHLDKPIEILKKLSNLLTNKGVLWLTTPTNAPALDHVYLFRSKNEVDELIRKSDLDIIDSYGCYAEDVTDEIAKKFKVSQLIGAFCKKKKREI